MSRMISILRTLVSETAANLIMCIMFSLLQSPSYTFQPTYKVSVFNQLTEQIVSSCTPALIMLMLKPELLSQKISRFHNLVGIVSGHLEINGNAFKY